MCEEAKSKIRIAVVFSAFGLIAKVLLGDNTLLIAGSIFFIIGMIETIKTLK